MAANESSAEAFRRVTAAAMRAIAERDDIQVNFGAEARLVDSYANAKVRRGEIQLEQTDELDQDTRRYGCAYRALRRASRTYRCLAGRLPRRSRG